MPDVVQALNYANYLHLRPLWHFICEGKLTKLLNAPGFREECFEH